MPYALINNGCFSLYLRLKLFPEIIASSFIIMLKHL